jgi:predicted XRE-type DNA-binding protein
MATRLRKSSGNVFRDLGFPQVDAENLRLRSELMVKLRRVIERAGLTQAAAAVMLGVTQPRVSDLVRGRIDLFSIDALVSMLSRAGVRVTVSMRARRSAANSSTAMPASRIKGAIGSPRSRRQSR